jgi:hypothetical protein
MYYQTSLHGHQVSHGRIAVTSQVGNHVFIADFQKLQSLVFGIFTVFGETKITF